MTVASDLDRTLIYSRSAIGPDAEEDQLHLVEMYEGRPQSFYTRNTHRLLEALRTVAEFVPATTRTVAQYRRITWATEPAYAVTSNGGRILADGRVDDDWSAWIAGVLAQECASFAEIGEHVRTAANQEGVRGWHEADGMFHYTVVDSARLPSGLIADLTGWCGERGWTVSMQGRKLYCVPRPLTKAAAVAEVHRRRGGRRLLAAGDSILDAELLASADAAIRPAHGELHRLDWCCPGLTVTVRSGILGGEDIAAWFLAAAASTDSGVPQPPCAALNAPSEPNRYARPTCTSRRSTSTPDVRTLARHCVRPACGQYTGPYCPTTFATGPVAGDETSDRGGESTGSAGPCRGRRDNA
ncbi:hypothetical protein GCM10010399_18250 [Dactylosporangium fulvum]|uniref:HAD family hydrolase n=1 Tax=Dactylosporangium fulvum TaxID=53359 RepID=A0ABY5VS11_9ACTN|nr:HAD family hydrolase [Dactylosporangium fulvum]UWP80350.1 HAD family hydrolase [Dactylosporangium fulvum]